MTDNDRLIGGYASSTLTRDERARLFTEALTDDAVFEALVEEEALREVFDQPAHRQALIAALAEPEPAWRRVLGGGWLVLSAAASVATLIIAAAVYYTAPPGAPTPAGTVAQQERPTFAPATERPNSTPPSEPTPRVSESSPAPVAPSVADWVVATRASVDAPDRVHEELPDAAFTAKSIGPAALVVIPDRPGRAAVFEIAGDGRGVKVFPAGDEWADARANEPIRVTLRRAPDPTVARVFRFVIVAPDVSFTDPAGLEAAVREGKLAVFSGRIPPDR